jgi:hypothetical protein
MELSSLAGPLAGIPTGISGHPPRLGLRTAPWLGHPGLRCSSTRCPAGPPPLQRPGWAGSGGSGLAGIPSPGRYGLVPARPDYGILVRPSLSTVPAGPGQDSLAQAGLFLPRLNYTSSGQDLPPPGHFPHPASTPSPCASPGMPLGSDWHIVHRYMRVLGRPLAQTSILLLS